MTGNAMTEEMPHILVVDDDLLLREVLRKYLMKNGFVVTTAQDAADARAKLESLAFDLLVLNDGDVPALASEAVTGRVHSQPVGWLPADRSDPQAT